MQYCSLQHWILLSSPDTPPPSLCFHFGPVTSFFLELLVVVLHSSPGAYWPPSNLGDSSFGVISSCLFIQFIGFSQQLYWGGLPFAPPVDHVLSELSTMTHPSWVALHIIARSFTELRKPLCHDMEVIHEGIKRLTYFYSSWEISPSMVWKAQTLFQKPLDLLIIQ